MTTESPTTNAAAVRSSDGLWRYVKITIRALMYAAGFVAVMGAGCFCMVSIFEAVDKLSKWILPIIFGGSVLFVCFIAACAKEYGWYKEKDDDET
jgi:hypothetical protein